MNLNQFATAPTLVDEKRSQRLRLNRVEIDGDTIELWSTAIAGVETWLTAGEVETLKADSDRRLYPLCQHLAKNQPVSVGMPHDSNDSEWEDSLTAYPSLEEAIAALQSQGIDTQIIDLLYLEDGVVSIGFMQLAPLGTEHYREVSLGEKPQNIFLNLS